MGLRTGRGVALAWSMDGRNELPGSRLGQRPGANYKIKLDLKSTEAERHHP